MVSLMFGTLNKPQLPRSTIYSILIMNNLWVINGTMEWNFFQLSISLKYNLCGLNEYENCIHKFPCCTIKHTKNL